MASTFFGEITPKQLDSFADQLGPEVPDPAQARVAAHCRRHGLLPAGAPVLAMVSGGADSTCLMHLLARIHDGPVGVLAIDHGLRPGAAAETDGVVAAAEALGLRAHREALAMEPGPGLQERARDLRLAAARRVAAREGYARIATGHTASDQAETVLFRIARGTGRTGALGMAPERDGVVRPLLVLDAAETRAWCAAHGIAGARPLERRPRPRPRARPRRARARAGRDPPGRRAPRRRAGGRAARRVRAARAARRGRLESRPRRRRPPPRRPAGRAARAAAPPRAAPRGGGGPARRRPRGGARRPRPRAARRRRRRLPPRNRARRDRVRAPRHLRPAHGATRRGPPARAGPRRVRSAGRERPRGGRGVAAPRPGGRRLRGAADRPAAPTGRPPRDPRRRARGGGAPPGGRGGAAAPAAARARGGDGRQGRLVAGHRAADDLIASGPGPALVLELEPA